jgi:hypothetical protein
MRVNGNAWHQAWSSCRMWRSCWRHARHKTGTGNDNPKVGSTSSIGWGWAVYVYGAAGMSKLWGCTLSEIPNRKNWLGGKVLMKVTSCRWMMNRSTRASMRAKALVGYCSMRWEWWYLRQATEAPPMNPPGQSALTPGSGSWLNPDGARVDARLEPAPCEFHDSCRGGDGVLKHSELLFASHGLCTEEQLKTIWG